MKLFDRFKKWINMEDEYFEDDDEVAAQEEQEEPRGKRRRGDSDYDELLRETRNSHRGGAQSGASGPARNTTTKVVDIHTTAKLQVVLKKPEQFDEAASIADELLAKRTVVLNLEATQKEHAGKLLCFLSGVAYANDGKIKRIANNTYIITPYNVDVMGDLLDELENNGMFFVD